MRLILLISHMRKLKQRLVVVVLIVTLTMVVVVVVANIYLVLSM